MKMLTRRGYEVREAASGEAALQLAQDCRFDLLICDVGLPGIDGWSLVKQIRKHCPRIHTIAVSGYGRKEDRTASQVAGFDVHLTKPVTMVQLEAAIAATVARVG
jgi:CheY-like chemotaxis protein